MERDGRVVSSKVRLVSAEPCHPVQRRDENACARTISIPAIRHFAIHCLPFAACIHTTPLPPLTTSIPLRIRKFETFETDRNSTSPPPSRVIIIRIRPCRRDEPPRVKSNLSFSARKRERERDRSEYVRRRKRLNIEPVSIRDILCVFRGIYIRVRRGSLPKPCRTASTRIYRPCFEPCDAVSIRGGIETVERRKKETERKGGEQGEARRGEAAVSR